MTVVFGEEILAPNSFFTMYTLPKFAPSANHSFAAYCLSKKLDKILGNDKLCLQKLTLGPMLSLFYLRNFRNFIT
jgi:hypothetical protein